MSNPSLEFFNQFEETYRVTANSTLDHHLLNSVFRNIDQRLIGVEVKKASFEVAEQLLLELGLRRINETLIPAAEKIFSLSELGFLTASSEAMLLPIDGQNLTIQLKSGAQADLFKPSPFIALVRQSTPDAYAIGHTVSYDGDNGLLNVQIVSVQNINEPYDDFDVAALAGSVKAMWDALQQSRALAAEIATKHSDVVAKAVDVVTKHQAVQTAHDETITAKDTAVAAAAQVNAIADFNPNDYVKKTGATMSGNLTVAGQIRSNTGVRVNNAQFYQNGNIKGVAWEGWHGSGYLKEAVEARIENRANAIATQIADQKIAAAFNAFKQNPEFSGTLKVTGEIKASGDIKAFTLSPSDFKHSSHKILSGCTALGIGFSLDNI